jgi:hypothetical protein
MGVAGAEGRAEEGLLHTRVMEIFPYREEENFRKRRERFVVGGGGGEANGCRS